MHSQQQHQHQKDILAALAAPSLDALEALLGADGAEAVADLRRLWALAEGYGYAEWLVFDASVVRGLAYYTGACCVLLCCVLVCVRVAVGVCTRFCVNHHQYKKTHTLI